MRQFPHGSRVCRRPRVLHGVRPLNNPRVSEESAPAAGRLRVEEYGVEPEALIAEYGPSVPVPGEPSIRGEGPLRILDRPYGKVGGAICYDYDFPAIAREHARGGADLVVVPSSDWRGIDPVHTFMARVRAVYSTKPIVKATALFLMIFRHSLPKVGSATRKAMGSSTYW